MHESRKTIVRLTESELKTMIAKSILETIEDRKDSYQAKPKNKGRLNDWEISNTV